MLYQSPMEDSAINSGKENRAAAPRLDAPADLHMRFDCQTIGEFLTRYADDVSRGGIFVRTRELLAVGCPVNLNLQLGNGVTLLDGSGTVFWTRGADPSSAEGEPGMGIRFGKITQQSQEMLTFLLAEKAKRAREEDGTTEFDNVRTVVSPNSEPDAADAENDDAAAEFHRARTVVVPVAKTQPLPSAAASTPTPPASRAAAVTLPVPTSVPVPPAATSAPVPPATTLAPVLPAAASKPLPSAATAEPPPPVAASENASETDRRERVPTFIPAGKSKKRLAIGLAVGGLLMLSACLGLLSWGSSGPMPSKATVSSAAAPPQPAPISRDDPGTNRP
jgi:uncharacterized protein (TIGR02266 family)